MAASDAGLRTSKHGGSSAARTLSFSRRFLAATAAVSVIVVPLVWLALAPWSTEVKLWLALLLGILDIGLPLGVLAYLLSEKKWMEISRSDELMESVLKKD